MIKKLFNSKPKASTFTKAVAQLDGLDAKIAGAIKNAEAIRDANADSIRELNIQNNVLTDRIGRYA